MILLLNIWNIFSWQYVKEHTAAPYMNKTFELEKQEKAEGNSIIKLYYLYNIEVPLNFVSAIKFLVLEKM